MLKRHSRISRACDNKGAVADRITEQIVSIGLHADSAYRVKGYVIICNERDLVRPYRGDR